jgi:hypothetical protein
MSAKEIREVIVKHRNNFGPNTAEANIAYWSSSCAQFLCEIAAQLAESNEKLNIILNPPLIYDTSQIEPIELHELSNPIMNVMQPRATLRDQFAMAAIHIVATVELDTQENIDLTARNAYKMADALMEARNK